MDRYGLQRFIDAQKLAYELALQEIRQGYKSSCWIWYIFPQLRGLNSSYRSEFYGISCREEAQEYLSNPILGSRLREITEALLAHKDKRAEDIFSAIDAKKLRSSMTLFDAISENDVFQQVLDVFYNGEKDDRTLEKLKNVQV